MDEKLAEIIGRIEAWKGAQAIEVSVLSGGLSNQNYRVDVDGEAYVVRVCGRDIELLGVNRQHEYESNLIAARSGVAPDVVAFLPDVGSIVTRFVHGRRLPAAEIATRTNLARAAKSIRTLHGSGTFPGRFSAFRAIEEYRRTAERLGAAGPANLDTTMAMAAEVERAMYGGAEASPNAACHNDLLNENFLDDGVIWIIDFEYAGMGDPLFDLGNFAAHHQLNDEQERWLIEAYFGDDTTQPSRYQARLKLMKLISDLREAMWGLVQTRVSALDYDYQAYADKHFWRVRATLDYENVERWMAEAAAKR